MADLKHLMLESLFVPTLLTEKTVGPNGDTKWLTNRFKLYIHPFVKNSDVNGMLCSSMSSLQARLELGSGLNFPACQGLFKWSLEVCVPPFLNAEISSKSRKVIRKKARRWKKRRSFSEKHLWYVSF